jgi:hypothetical protein
MQINLNTLNDFFNYASSLGCVVEVYGSDRCLLYDSNHIFEINESKNGYLLGSLKMKDDENLYSWEQKYWINLKYYNNNTFDLEFMKKYILNLVNKIKMANKLYDINQRKQDLERDFKEL